MLRRPSEPVSVKPGSLQVVGWSYDANGNLLADDEATYAFDELDRLTSASRPGSDSSFTWDSEGNLLDQTQNGVTRSLVVDSASGLARVLFEADPASPGTPTASYSYAGATSPQLLSLTNDQGHRWAHADALGSIRTLGDDTGVATDGRTYNAYGEPGPFNSGTNTQPFGFTGQLTDGSGPQWLRARWYAPEQGRFLSRDPSAFGVDTAGVFLAQHPTGGSANPYAYASGSPTNRLDPGGTFDLGGTIATIAVFAMLTTIVVASISPFGGRVQGNNPGPNATVFGEGAGRVSRYPKAGFAGATTSSVPPTSAVSPDEASAVQERVKAGLALRWFYDIGPDTDEPNECHALYSVAQKAIYDEAIKSPTTWAKYQFDPQPGSRGKDPGGWDWDARNDSRWALRSGPTTIGPTSQTVAC